MPIRSVNIVGYISTTPPTAIATRSSAGIFLDRNPFSAAAREKMPSSAVMIICITSNTVVSTKSIAGLRQKIYGTMNSAISSYVAVMPVFMGLDFAMAEPAYAASATGGVISATMPK